MTVGSMLKPRGRNAPGRDLQAYIQWRVTTIINRVFKVPLLVIVTPHGSNLVDTGDKAKQLLGRRTSRAASLARP